MTDVPDPSLMAAVGGMLFLLLFGVSFLGVKSLQLRRRPQRAVPWLLELWLFAVLFGTLSVLSARAVDYRFVESVQDALAGLRSMSGLLLATTGLVLALVCAYRMLMLLREGVGEFGPVAWDEGPDEGDGDPPPEDHEGKRDDDE